MSDQIARPFQSAFVRIELVRSNRRWLDVLVSGPQLPYAMPRIEFLNLNPVAEVKTSPVISRTPFPDRGVLLEEPRRDLRTKFLLVRNGRGKQLAFRGLFP
jgi:hypothetical protein